MRQFCIETINSNLTPESAVGLDNISYKIYEEGKQTKLTFQYSGPLKEKEQIQNLVSNAYRLLVTNNIIPSGIENISYSY